MGVMSEGSIPHCYLYHGPRLGDRLGKGVGKGIHKCIHRQTNPPTANRDLPGGLQPIVLSGPLVTSSLTGRTSRGKRDSCFIKNLYMYLSVSVVNNGREKTKTRVNKVYKKTIQPHPTLSKVSFSVSTESHLASSKSAALCD